MNRSPESDEPVISPFNDVRERVRQFNEDEAVWRCFQDRQNRRRHQKNLPPKLKKLLEELDWRMAEREARPIHAIGIWINP